MAEKNELAIHKPPIVPISLMGRLLTLAAIIVPFMGLVAAVFFVWGWGFHWVDLGLLLGMYFLTAMGITAGFHRLFVHRAFETNIVVKFVLGIFGSMAVQASLFAWVAQHRAHHQFSDRPDDPHSPHHQGTGFLGWLLGLWHAHIGWAFDPDRPDLDHYIQDLPKSPSLRVVNALFPIWVILGLALPAVVGGLITGTWMGALLGMIWGGFVRIFLVHHVTWSVNSVCHLWGFRPYQCHDESRDNFVVGVLAMGEGWHNTHHAFPTSVRHGLRWWQLDVTYWFIRVLALVGLAWNLRQPSKEAQAQMRRIRPACE